jgi:ribosomal peptide maturation radical SAM protein 1
LRVLLVNVPWASIDVPSLALGVLRQSVLRSFPDAEVDVLHANLDFVDWVTERTQFGVEDYHYYSHDSYFQACGDWIFSTALFPDISSPVSEFERYLADQADAERLAANRRLRALGPDFVQLLAERLVAERPDVVGFTSTFRQNVAALATARAVKRLAPEIVTVMGGANCDGVQGEAVHRNFPFVDFVVRGEGEVSLPQLLRALRGGAEFADVPGLCWRNTVGESMVNAMSTRPLSPGEMVVPDFDSYFERFGTSVARTWVEPKLLVEGARGCWWGEKHHCTFCGLNGSSMKFRSKSPSTFFDELVGLARRYQVLDAIVVDNILDMGYFTSLLPRLAESGYGLRLQCEIKANLRREQLQALHDAGVVAVQPGIENLSSHVLKLMDKGVTGCQNVRLLRDAASTGITVSWNYLYGFPGESNDDYLSIISQIPALHHLTPADSARIEIERFSPYFNRPELGFAGLRPGREYTLTYELPERELYDLAYVFDAPHRGIGEELAIRLQQVLAEWLHAFPRSRLTYWDLGEHIVLASERLGFGWTTLQLTDPLEVAAFRLLDQPHTPTALARKLPDAADASMAAMLHRWMELGLVFTDAGQYIHVACAATNSELLRIDTARPNEHLPEPVR